LDRPIRVLIVEDFQPFRRIVVSLVQQQPELQVVGEVSDGLEAVHKATELQPDLILMDIGLPKLNGIEAAGRIRALSPKSKILFVSQETSTDVAQAALAVGAGYLIKSDATKELLTAMRAVVRGERFVSRRLEGSDFGDALQPQVSDTLH
jgi:DNA-binding NarL/FixJ family response regulator